ncbi:MAG: AMP-binding protein [Pseudomonadota bacterium]
MGGDVYFAGEHYTSANIADAAARAASGLRALGAKNGRVALFMRNDVAFLAASEAARQAGAITLPVNCQLKAEDLAYILEDSGADVVIAHADLWRHVGRHLPTLLKDRLSVIVVPTPIATCTAFQIDPTEASVPQDVLDWNTLIAENVPLVSPETTDLYPLIYTSGTTGRPKGVQRLATTTPAPVAYDAFFEADMRTLLAAPLYHSAPNRFLQGTFHAGGTLVLSERFSAEAILKDMERHRITTTFMVPAMFQRLIQLPSKVRHAHDLTSLRHVVVAGAPCPVDLKAAMIDWWGPVIYEYYGSTETSALTFASSDDAIAKPGTVGRTVPTAEIKILDEARTPCLPGISGEIFGRRLDIPDFTYLNSPDARAAVSAGDLVSVGDVGYLDEDGYLFVNDRKTDMIISNGMNVYPAQVEAAVMNHPAIRDCAVFGIPDAKAGEAVAAIIQTDKESVFDQEELAAYLDKRLPAYMVPKLIKHRQDFPRDETGKIKKSELRAPYWQGCERKI